MISFPTSQPTPIAALINAVIAVEGGNTANGGYTNDPTDRGGETVYGITAAVARAFGYTGPMISMPRTTAYSIYLQRFWVAPHFDQLDQLSPRLAAKLFDVGVNTGQSTGIKYLQRSLNVLNLNGASWPDMLIDGGLGTISLGALKTFLQQRGLDGERVLLGMVTALQSAAYIADAEANPTQEKYEYGWQLNRVIGSLAA